MALTKGFKKFVGLVGTVVVVGGLVIAYKTLACRQTHLRCNHRNRR
jgi:hypothetical protein